MKAGFEAEANKFFFVRAGYNGSLTLGTGIKLEPSEIFSVKIDYAFVSDNILPDSFNQRIGVVVENIFPNWGSVEEGEEREEQKQDKKRGEEEPW